MILVTGSGLLGSEVVKTLGQDHGEVTGTCHSKPKAGAVPLDLTDREGTIGTIISLKPDIIVHTAAMTNVDYCEDHRKEAMAANADGTKNIVDAAKKTNSKVIYVSTDFVFDGMKGMYREDDPVDPVSYYAYSKLIGEYYVKDLPSYIIARTSVIYGNARQNYVSWVKDSLENGQKIRVVTDQYNSPTLSIDCAEAISALIKHDVNGVYHVAGGERVSRYEFARKIASFYGLDDSLIEPVVTEALNQKAKRPMDSSLDVSKIGAYHKMLNITDGLKKMNDLRGVK